jgi:hypothetical protein
MRNIALISPQMHGILGGSLSLSLPLATTALYGAAVKAFAWYIPNGVFRLFLTL